MRNLLNASLTNSVPLCLIGALCQHVASISETLLKRIFMDDFLSLIPLVWAPVLALSISAIYFMRAKQMSMLARLGVSAHGVAIAVLYFSAFGVAFFGCSKPALAMPLTGCCFCAGCMHPVFVLAIRGKTSDPISSDRKCLCRDVDILCWNDGC